MSTASMCALAGRHDIGIVMPPHLVKAFKPLIESNLASHVNENLHLWMFDTQEDLFYNVRTNVSREYCFAFEFSDIRPGI